MLYDGGASALGTLFISKFIAQAVYESHIDENDEDSDGLTCYGEECFRTSHLIIVGLALTCVLASVAMLRRTQHAYSRLSSSDYVALD